MYPKFYRISSKLLRRPTAWLALLTIECKGCRFAYSNRVGTVIESDRICFMNLSLAKSMGFFVVLVCINQVMALLIRNCNISETGQDRATVSIVCIYTNYRFLPKSWQNVWPWMTSKRDARFLWQTFMKILYLFIVFRNLCGHVSCQKSIKRSKQASAQSASIQIYTSIAQFCATPRLSCFRRDHRNVNYSITSTTLLPWTNKIYREFQQLCIGIKLWS